VIAEAGVNHNGDRDKAFQLVDAAAAAGADAVKFQIFSASDLVTKSAEKACYQKAFTGGDARQLEMLQQLELPFDVFRELAVHCRDRGIIFLSTAFGQDSLYFLVDELGVNTLKIPSGDITNGPLLLAHARTRRNLIVSTGMATLGEIEDALALITFGLLGSKEAPSATAFRAAYQSSTGQDALREMVTLLHCTTEYPAPLDEINLAAMKSMAATFGLPVGYSDHSEGIAVPVAAAAMGACIIEKHFTLDRNLPGPDHKASLEPDELAEMVRMVRVVSQARGSPVKGPTRSELRNLGIARRSLVASRPILCGEVFTEENVSIKRPGTGISPMRYWEVIGTESQRDYSEDEMLK